MILKNEINHYLSLSLSLSVQEEGEREKTETLLIYLANCKQK